MYMNICTNIHIILFISYIYIYLNYVKYKTYNRKKDWKKIYPNTNIIIYLFYREGTEAQRNQTTCPRLWWQNWGHSWALGLAHAQSSGVPSWLLAVITGQLKIFFNFIIIFFFLGLHPWHIEVPRLWVELKLQLLACAAAMATLDLCRLCHLYHGL